MAEGNNMKERIKLIEEAINDYNKGKLTDVSCLIAINMIVNKKKCSPECTEWAEKVLEHD